MSTGRIAVPMMDVDNESELEAFIREMGNGVRPVAQARRIFPTKPKGYVEAARDLRNAAWNALTARQCRKRGDIQGALMYEGITDRIYNKLPAWAKWDNIAENPARRSRKRPRKSRTISPRSARAAQAAIYAGNPKRRAPANQRVVTRTDVERGGTWYWVEWSGGSISSPRRTEKHARELLTLYPHLQARLMSGSGREYLSRIDAQPARR
jgi:hypothetical protein